VRNDGQDYTGVLWKTREFARQSQGAGGKFQATDLTELPDLGAAMLGIRPKTAGILGGAYFFVGKEVSPGELAQRLLRRCNRKRAPTNPESACGLGQEFDK
jgi:hypothetical protein